MQVSRALNGAPFCGIEGVLTSDNAVIFPDTLDQVIGWNGDNTVAYIEVVAPPTPDTTWPGGTYRQTFTYSAGRVTSISKWVRQ